MKGDKIEERKNVFLFKVQAEKAVTCLLNAFKGQLTGSTNKAKTQPSRNAL